MAEKQPEDSKVNSSESEPSPPPFIEVRCKYLDKATRFAAGTKAGFAVSLINRKLGIIGGVPAPPPFVSHIEAVKDGDESINFGPDALLVDYGSGWKLHAVTELDFVGVNKAERIRLIPKLVPNVITDGLRPAREASESGFGFLYILKILLAFAMIFVLGAVFTLALENLPKMILLINSCR